MIQNVFIKIVACIVSAFLVAAFLFYFMSVLISGTPNLTNQDELKGLIEFIRVNPKTFLNEKTRQLPKKKPKEKKIPKMKPLSNVMPQPQRANLEMNGVDLKAALKGGGSVIGGSVGDDYSGGSPLVRINPQYPPKAAMQGVEGWVRLQFNISPIGSVIAVRVLDAQPRNVFNKSAVESTFKMEIQAFN